MEIRELINWSYLSVSLGEVRTAIRSDYTPRRFKAHREVLDRKMGEALVELSMIEYAGIKRSEKVVVVEWFEVDNLSLYRGGDYETKYEKGKFYAKKK